MSEYNGNGRDPMSGRFAPGAKAGPGSGLSRRMYEIKKWFVGSATVEELTKARAKLVEMMLDGDPAATRLYWESIMGKPTQSVQLSGPEGQPLGMDVAAFTSVVLAALAKHPEAKAEIITALESAKRADS
jgi:hypothetical protein